MSSGTRIRIGILTRPSGLAGAIRCALDAEAIPTIATPCDTAIGYSESFTEPIRLERYEERSGDLICYFAGITTREAAARIADRALYLPMEALSYRNPLSAPLLIGYEVRDEAGTVLGTLESIFQTPAHYIWQVRNGTEEWMVPAIEQFVLDVRHQDRVAIVRPIPGMVIEEPEERDDAG